MKPLFFLILFFAGGQPLLGNPACIHALAQAAFTRAEASHYAEDKTGVLLEKYKNDPQFAYWLDHSWQPDFALGEAAYAPEEILTEYQYDKPHAHKKTQPKRVNLFDDDALAVRHSGMCTACFLTTGRNNFAPTEYYARVLTLREGDTVDFGDRQFKLGRFLGRGNTSHIFELADYPDLVIRIPFYAPDKDPMDKPTRMLTQTATEMFHSLFAAQLNLIPDSVPKIKIFETDARYRWMTVSKVNGKENGKTFLLQIKKATAPTDRERILAERLRAHIWTLVQGYNVTIGKTLQPISEERYIHEARQFLLDEKDNWVLVDPL